MIYGNVWVQTRDKGKKTERYIAILKYADPKNDTALATP